jgi:hypothetical protein
MISGFRREVDEICALLGYYTACSGNSLLTFSIFKVKNPKILGFLIVLDFLTPDNGTDRLSRNVGKELPVYTA